MSKFVVCYTDSDEATYSYPVVCPVVAESKEQILQAFMDAVQQQDQIKEQHDSLRRAYLDARASGDQQKIDQAQKAWFGVSHLEEFELHVLGYNFSDFEPYRTDYKGQKQLVLPEVYTLEEWFDIYEKDHRS